MKQQIKKGDSVKFYDSRQANIDKDYSGKNPNHYPIGIVDKVYIYHSSMGYSDEVCDIIFNGKISKSHFTRMIIKIPN